METSVSKQIKHSQEWFMATLFKYISLAPILLVDFFYPTGKFLLLIGFFVMMDTITGVVVAKKQGDFNSKNYEMLFINTQTMA